MPKKYWRPTWGLWLESRISTKVGPSLDPRNRPTGSSTIPTPDEPWNFYFHTNTEGVSIHKVTQEVDSTWQNICKSMWKLIYAQCEGHGYSRGNLSRFSHIYRTRHQPSGRERQVKKINNWKYLTEFMLDVIRASEVGTWEIPTPHKYLRQGWWGNGSNTNTWPINIQNTTQEALVVARKESQMKDLDIQVGI